MAQFLVFGEKIPDKNYQLRIGAYGIIFGTEKRIAVIQTHHGFFLPGGGIEAEETIEQGLKREIREECGFTIEIKSYIGEAIDYLYAESEQTYFAKHSHFYLINCFEFNHPPIEKNHFLKWLEPPSAAYKLFQKSHSWAVRQTIL
jgi:8-oxo-dGTP diphosphatase